MTSQQIFLQECASQVRASREQAEKALQQISDEAFFFASSLQENSIAILVKHLGGNLRSRWTDFLTSDGEKPDRDRDSEFEIAASDTRTSLMKQWDNGFDRMLETLTSLTPDDFEQTVSIRGEAHTVTRAVIRSITHIAYHVGQIVQLARSGSGENWKTLSIARGRSREFNEKMGLRKD
ncbi:MAG: DinB family protein [Bdellovibrionota bacterium]